MRLLLLPIWIALFVATWLVMGVPIAFCCMFDPDVVGFERVQLGLAKSVSADMLLGPTLLCPFNAATQYLFWTTARRIVFDDVPAQWRPFSWLRLGQSLVIAWVLWYASIIYACWH